MFHQSLHSLFGYTTKELDGIVVTGPGPAKKFFARPASPRIFDGDTFWRKETEVRNLLKGRDSRVVAIIGGGGTAAAIAAWLLREYRDRHNFTLIHNQATLFTRTTNFFENRIFDDAEAWAAISDKERRAFADRLNRGVVWESVAETLANAETLALVPGKVTSVQLAPAVLGVPDPQLIVHVSNALSGGPLVADVVIDATGFDGWWFRNLFSPTLGKKFSSDRQKDKLSVTMRGDLSFDLPNLPRLHVPMQSHHIGPGFMSLMVLGGMSDRILEPYIRASAPAP